VTCTPGVIARTGEHVVSRREYVRELLEKVRGDDGVGDVDDRRVTDHGDRLGDRCDAQRDIEVRGEAGCERDAFADDGAEPLQRETNSVGPAGAG
jgi:hypothetical protein